MRIGCEGLRVSSMATSSTSTSSVMLTAPPCAMSSSRRSQIQHPCMITPICSSLRRPISYSDTWPLTTVPSSHDRTTRAESASQHAASAIGCVSLDPVLEKPGVAKRHPGGLEHTLRILMTSLVLPRYHSTIQTHARLPSDAGELRVSFHGRRWQDCRDVSLER